MSQCDEKGQVSSASSASEPGVTMLVDDVRRFRDGRECMVARTSTEALALLEELGGRRIADLWLDHDLIGDDTVMPFVDRLVDQPHDVGVVHVHTANVVAGRVMVERLGQSGYRVQRTFSLGMWTW